MSKKTKVSKKRMSIEDFLTELKKTPRKWGLNKTGRLVFDGEDVCPISAVAGILLSGEAESEALDYECAKKLGLSKSNAAEIISAADSGRAWGKLRMALLKACSPLVDSDEDDKDDKDDDYENFEKEQRRLFRVDESGEEIDDLEDDYSEDSDAEIYFDDFDEE